MGDGRAEGCSAAADEWQAAISLTPDTGRNHILKSSQLEGSHVEDLVFLWHLRADSASVVKKPPANAGDARDGSLTPGSGRSPRAGNGHTPQYFLPGEFHGQRSLAGYSPWGHKRAGHN